MTINYKDLNTMILCTTRYGLGRKTYIILDVAELLIKYKDEISSSIREIICKEIEQFLKYSKAPNPELVQSEEYSIWQNALEQLKNVKDIP